MKIGWALDMIGWAFAQPFPTLAAPLGSNYILDSKFQNIEIPSVIPPHIFT